MSTGSRVAVTGATGFIGSSIVKTLTNAGEDVLGIDLSTEETTPFDAYLGDQRSQVDLVEADLRNEERLLDLAGTYDIDAVIHAAVFTVVAEEVEREYTHDILETNLMGTVNTLEMAKEADAENFVYVSSSGVYGSSEDITESITEDAVDPYMNVDNLYLISKIASEKTVHRYSNLLDLTGVSARIAAPYGPMERPTQTRRQMGPIYRLLAMILDEEISPIKVKGLEYVRDWTYVMDIADGIVDGLTADDPLTYNITYGVNYSLKEILETAQGVDGLNFDWEPVENEEEADFTASVSSLRGPLSNTRAKKQLGFDPSYDLKRGLQAYADWWQTEYQL